MHTYDIGAGVVLALPRTSEVCPYVMKDLILRTSEVFASYGLHPVSITRFPLSRFSPGAGLLRHPFFYTINAKTFQGLGPKRRESCNGDRV